MAVKISEVLPAPEKVDTGNGQFEVNGLALSHIVALINRHRDNFTKLLVLKDNKPDYGYILSTAPELVVDVIAMASNSDNDTERAAIRDRLPVSVQLTALETVWRLTVPDVGKLKALLSGVMAQLGVSSLSGLRNVQHAVTESMEPSKVD